MLGVSSPNGWKVIILKIYKYKGWGGGILLIIYYKYYNNIFYHFIAYGGDDWDKFSKSTTANVVLIYSLPKGLF